MAKYSHSDESGSSALSSESFPSSIARSRSSSLSGCKLAGSSSGSGVVCLHLSSCRAPLWDIFIPLLPEEGFLNVFTVDLGRAPDPLPLFRPAGILNWQNLKNAVFFFAVTGHSWKCSYFSRQSIEHAHKGISMTFDLHMSCSSSCTVSRVTLDCMYEYEWWICRSTELCVLWGSLPSYWLNWAVEKDHQKQAK